MVEDSDHEDPRPMGPGWPATMVVGDRSRGRRETCGGFAALTGGVGLRQGQHWRRRKEERRKKARVER